MNFTKRGFANSGAQSPSCSRSPSVCQPARSYSSTFVHVEDGDDRETSTEECTRSQAPTPMALPTAAEIFGPMSGVKLAARQPLNDLVRRTGMHELTSASPAEDLREALELLRDEAAAAQLDATDRATLRKLVLDLLGERKIRHAQPMVRAAFRDFSLGGTSRDRTIMKRATFALTDEEPAPEATDGAALLDQTTGLIRRHVVLNPAQALAVALWVGAAYSIEALDLMPLLLITSPTMRSGKTTLLTLIGALAPRPLFASNVTGAVLARAIATFSPTLLADEADTWLTDQATELRGILNAGHSRPTAYVLRCAPETHEPTLIRCFSPRVIAMIRRPPSTISDRAVTISLRRKRGDEHVKRFRADRLFGDCQPLRRAWRRWALDHLVELRDIDPDVPPSLHDRAADNWRPLLAIADLVGSEWSAQARVAAVRLSKESDDEEDATIQLLEDIRNIFREVGDPEVLGSNQILDRLLELDHRPWGEWSHGRPLSAARMARLLAPYNIHPAGTVRIGVKTLKGYRRSAFVDVWTRYLPSVEASGTEPSHRNEASDLGFTLIGSETSRPSTFHDLQRVTGGGSVGSGDGVTARTSDSVNAEYLEDDVARY